MRNPDRIGITLETIGEIWKKYPDLRLGQLLCNVGNFTTLYYIEDGQLLDILQKYYGKVEFKVKKLEEEPAPVIISETSTKAKHIPMERSNSNVLSTESIKNPRGRKKKTV